MALKVDATFQNGVFVPAARLDLTDREPVRLTIETTAKLANPGGFRRGDRPAHAQSRTDCDLAVALDFHPDGC